VVNGTNQAVLTFNREILTMILNTNLGIKAQALAVFHVLAEDFNNEFSSSEIEASAASWYNGRERGIVVWFDLYRKTGASGKYQLVLVFGEHRCSDGIFLETWTVHNGRDIGGAAGHGSKGNYSYFNVPTFEDENYDKAYENRWEFGCGAVGDVVEAAMGLIRGFLSPGWSL
jgi:hypothetical protein